jgi:hypothetical protein
MVQEHVAWFKDKRSPTYRLPVRVTAPLHELSPPQPRRLITDLVTAEGATLVGAQDCSPLAANFVTYRYYMVK